MRLLSALLLGALLAFGSIEANVAASTAKSAPARTGKSAQDANIQALRALLKTPEVQLDFAKAKLTIDRMIDPSIDVPSTLRQLDAMAAQIRLMLPAGANRRTTMVTLMTYLYQPGLWNSHRPFSYDLNDPYGKNIRNKLLPTYLSTRKGNCVSMPVLFVVLGQMIGLDVTLSTAPTHVFAKFRDDDDRWVNIENTSVGTKSDSGYQKDYHITPKAIANGVYLKTLSKRESVVVMMGTLMEFYGESGRQTRRIALVDLALGVYPKDVGAMLQKGNAYYQMMKQKYLDKYGSPAGIPPEQRHGFEVLSRNNLLWFAKAEALGWREPTQAEEAAYEKSIQHTKAVKQRGR